MSQADIDAIANVNAPPPQILPVTIAQGTSLSTAVSFRGILGKIVMPAAWDAAALTIATSDDGGTTWNDLYDQNGTLLTLQAAASRAIYLGAADFLVIRMVKIRSGTPTAPVNQTAARTITLVAI